MLLPGFLVLADKKIKELLKSKRNLPQIIG
jgi:hypothetical protein